MLKNVVGRLWPRRARRVRPLHERDEAWEREESRAIKDAEREADRVNVQMRTPPPI